MPLPRARGRPGDRLDPAPEPQTAFLFPRMPFAEIQDDMSAYNRPMTKETFRNPSAADVRALLDFFIEEIYDKRPEDFAQPAFGCLDEVEYPELYEDAIPKLHLASQAQKLFTDAHFDEFGLRDLHAPEKVRFHWQLSALINFDKFRQTRLSVFEEITGNADELAERERKVREEKAHFEREIADIEEMRARDEPEVEGLRESVAEQMQQLGTLHKQQKELQDRIADAKATLTKQTEHAAAVKVRKMSEMEEVDRYRTRVVSSPDRVKGEIEEMEGSLAAEKESVSAAERQCRAMTQRTSAVRAATEQASKALVAMKALLAEQERASALRKDIEEREAVKAEKQKERMDIDQSKAHLAREVESVQQKLARVKEQSTNVHHQSSEADRALAIKEAEHEREEREIGMLVEEKTKLLEEKQNLLLAEAQAVAEEAARIGEKQAMLNDKFTAFHITVENAQTLITQHNTTSFEELRKAVL